MHKQLGWALPSTKTLAARCQLPVHLSGPQLHVTTSGTSSCFSTPLDTVGSLTITLRTDIKQTCKQVKGRPEHTAQNKM